MDKLNMSTKAEIEKATEYVNKIIASQPEEGRIALVTLLAVAHRHLEGELVIAFTEPEICSELLAIRDENGDDPFFRYQIGNASQGWLRHFIAHAIVELQKYKHNTV